MYPADFMLVASTNPCPCGFYPNLNRCNCRPQAIKNYIGRISQAFFKPYGSVCGNGRSPVYHDEGYAGGGKQCGDPCQGEAGT